MSKISIFDPLEPGLVHATPVPEDAIIVFELGSATIEIRHRGDYLEIHRAQGSTAHRLMVEPRVSNQLWLHVLYEARDTTEE